MATVSVRKGFKRTSVILVESQPVHHYDLDTIWFDLRQLTLPNLLVIG